jgi:uncharacterized membrane protein YdjX (TVP38/TMEM64 family)
MSEPETNPPRHTVGQRVVAVVTVAALAGLALLLIFAGRPLLHYFRHPAELRQLMQGWGAWAPLGIVLFQTLQILVAPLPGNAMSFAAGYALGLWPAIVWLMLGVLLGAAADFLLARLLGRRLLAYLVPPDRLARLDSVILRRGTFYVFLLLLVPNPLGDWIYYLAGLTALPLPLFLVFVLVARLPSNLIECALGASATRFAWPHWVALGALAAALTLLYFAYQRQIEAWLERVSTRRPKAAS